MPRHRSDWYRIDHAPLGNHPAGSARGCARSRLGPVAVQRPSNGFDKADLRTVSLTLVEAREIDPPANEDPLPWRLLATIAVSDTDGACEITRL